MKTTSFIASLLILSATSFAQTWNVDKAHSRLGYGVSHLGISESEGSFKDYTATITSSKEDFSDAVVAFSANIASINTENEQRDKHLTSPDFFDAEKYPTMTFKSTSFKKVGDKKYKVAGDLTLHGVTKPVTLDAVLNGVIPHPMNKKQVAGFKITGTIKRSDFGVAAGMPATMLGDEVALRANTEFVKD